MEFLSESNQIPEAGEYDVIVVGGGIAGIGAALAARRNGCRVLIIEKSVVLGGLATLGFIAIYLPLCDGHGKKVTGGIAEELLHLSIKYGYNDLEPEWKDGKGVGVKKRYTTVFSPPEFIYALDELMVSEGIDLLFDTVFCKPVMDGSRCGRSSWKTNQAARHTQLRCSSMHQATRISFSGQEPGVLRKKTIWPTGSTAPT